MRPVFAAFVVALLAFGSVARAEESDALERAHKHYESGVSLFESGNKEQALVEFQLANDIAPKKENIFMIAQCEYHLGQLVNARTHYQDYLADQPQGELADLARLRIEAINRRPGIFVINTVPDDVDVRIEGESNVITGQAPNEFRVPRGHYRLTVSKPNYGSETRDLWIDVAEAKPLFFKLEPIPAHLVIRTVPDNAALFVRGNRAQNPYAQDVPPGTYEIYAEASYYQPKRDSITLQPGEARTLEFPLTYVQRSGRPELIGFWTGIGAVGGGLLVLTQGNTADPAAPLSLSLFSAGMLAGGLGLGVISSTTSLVPDYIRDNLALFRIGTMWIGDVEGAALGMAITHSWKPTWVGGALGLTAGAFAGWWLDDHAPNYGRVAVIQSSALLGAVAGAIAVPAFGLFPTFSPPDPKLGGTGPAQIAYDEAFNHYRSHAKQRVAWGLFAGLNVGVAAGLAMAYLPDQREYGPSWQRALLVDLAGIAGGIFASAIELCSRADSHCADNNNSTTLNDRTAQFALAGTGIGLFTGWILTMNYDYARTKRAERPMLSVLPMPGVVPVQSETGTAQLLPGLLSRGSF